MCAAAAPPYVDRWLGDDQIRIAAWPEGETMARDIKLRAIHDRGQASWASSVRLDRAAPVPVEDRLAGRPDIRAPRGHPTVAVRYGRSTSLTAALGFIDEVSRALPHKCLVPGPPKVIEPVRDVGVGLPDVEYLVLYRPAVGDRDLSVGP